MLCAHSPRIWRCPTNDDLVAGSAPLSLRSAVPARKSPSIHGTSLRVRQRPVQGPAAPIAYGVRAEVPAAVVNVPLGVGAVLLLRGCQRTRNGGEDDGHRDCGFGEHVVSPA